MYLAVRKCLNDNNAIWAPFAGIGSVVTLFLAKITQIQNTENRQQRSTSGATNTKKELKTELIDLLLVVIGALKSYAKDINDENLFSSVDFNLSDLERIGDSLLTDRGNLILGIANTHAASILDKGVTMVMLGDLLTLVNEYDASAVGPRNVISDKKTATEQLAVLVEETDEILNENLDGLILQFKTTNNDFFLNYFNNRTVIDVGTQHTRLGGTVVDGEGNPIEGAVIIAVDTDLEEETDENGEYLFKPFIPGDFTITIEKEGFETQTISNVHVSPGQHFVLGVTLVREVLSGTVNSGQVINLLSPSNPRWVAGATLKLKNTSVGVNPVFQLLFYPANSPGEGWMSGGNAVQVGNEITVTIDSGMFKPYFNIQNQSPEAQSYEVTIL